MIVDVAIFILGLNVGAAFAAWLLGGTPAIRRLAEIIWRGI